MKSTNEPAFTIIDRRGQNRAEEVAPSLETKDEKSHQWQDICYKLEIAQAGPGMLVSIGRAVGLRSDGKTFMADYMIFPLVTDNTLDWRPHAKKRLETFLKCECDIAHGACAVHKLYLPQWIQQDQHRYEEQSRKPVPRALEVQHQAEVAARQRNLVVPR